VEKTEFGDSLVNCHSTNPVFPELFIYSRSYVANMLTASLNKQ